MSGAPLCSIVIPNRDYGRFLPRLFLSLLRQTTGLSEMEIILVDDDSRDQSLTVAELWRKRLACVHFDVVRAAGLGRPGAVRDVGLRRARGKYFLPLDADDHLDPRYLERCLEALEGPTAPDLVCTDYVRSSAGVSRIVRLPEPEPDLLRRQNILGPTAMMGRWVWERCGGYRRNTAYEEWDLWLHAALRGHAFARVAAPLYFQEEHPANRFRETRKQDGKAKAMLVVNNQAYFDPGVVRWALGLLRSEPWAPWFETGLIPREDEVRALFDAYIKDAVETKRLKASILADAHMRLLVA